METPKAKPAVASPPAVSGDKTSSVTAQRDADGLRVVFSFAAATPAALFRRAVRVERHQGFLHPVGKCLEALLIRRRQGRILRQMMLEQKVPQPRTLSCKIQVGLGHAQRSCDRITIFGDCRKAALQLLEQAPLHMQNHVIEVLIHIVDGAWGVIDAPRNFARRQPGQAMRFNNRLGRI